MVRDDELGQGRERPKTGFRALQLYQQVANAEAFRAATALAKAMIEKLARRLGPDGAGLVGLEMAGRAEQWADGLQIAKTREAAQGPAHRAERAHPLHFRVGNFESRLGQHENAIASFRKALAKGDHEAHRRVVAAMLSAKRPPAEIEKEVRSYVAAFPERADRFELLAQVAHAYANAKEVAKALQLAQEVMAEDVDSGDFRAPYVTWCGDNHAQAERGLLQALKPMPQGAAKLRAVLALEVYRDGMKDAGKARGHGAEFLARSPTGDGWTEYVIGYLLESAPDDNTFQARPRPGGAVRAEESPLAGVPGAGLEVEREGQGPQLEPTSRRRSSSRTMRP